MPLWLERVSLWAALTIIDGQEDLSHQLRQDPWLGRLNEHRGREKGPGVAVGTEGATSQNPQGTCVEYNKLQNSLPKGSSVRLQLGTSSLQWRGIWPPTKDVTEWNPVLALCFPAHCCLRPSSLWDGKLHEGRSFQHSGIHHTPTILPGVEQRLKKVCG